MTQNENELRIAAGRMVKSLIGKVNKQAADYPNPESSRTDAVVRFSNDMGYAAQAVEFIVDMAKTYHEKEGQQ